MTPLDFTCSECMMLANAPCEWGEVVDHPPFHAARMEAAAAHSIGESPTQEQWAKAVNDTGLV